MFLNSKTKSIEINSINNPYFFLELHFLYSPQKFGIFTKIPLLFIFIFSKIFDLLNHPNLHLLLQHFHYN